MRRSIVRRERQLGSIKVGNSVEHAADGGDRILFDRFVELEAVERSGLEQSGLNDDQRSLKQRQLFFAFQLHDAPSSSVPTIERRERLNVPSTRVTEAHLGCISAQQTVRAGRKATALSCDR